MIAGPTAATRPHNRKQLIVEAAGQVFSERGYHAASMEEIAAGVGISAAALYRHFPNKYALFAGCADVMADRLVAALDDAPPDAGLPGLLTALIRVTITHRASGGLYRWEARYLDRDDRRRLRAKFEQVVTRIAGRTIAGGTGARLRAVAALGVIGSVTMHHTSIAQRRIEEMLLVSALRVAATEAFESAARVDLPAPPVPRTRRAEILAAAIPLFARDGFANVTNGQIASAVGLAPSAIYRHYPGKIDILVAACLQAAGLLSQAVERSSPSLDSLTATYVAYSFEHNALNSVAEAEIRGLPADLRRPLILAQREYIAVWEHQLRAARPELDPRQARLLVHACFGVVVEAGRALRWEDTPGHRDAVTALATNALGSGAVAGGDGDRRVRR
ncbi:TetR/AcrR family transcriptional regulator [Actinoplanes couchii]|uniref:TetR family transcriptional regulator n=1 Tax=Actinoplanes couchii TaxID=403638 RepID=A0ABQ3XMB8_9ACTN|nr:TetR/AcrR family transcriptional regulator [Actinoplanes couchii]MDR6321547.1 AcrR family transcriptional regulator [Actinoplanes couchii]GID59644.1 TetR family transcriptional regulator [Actinoplanes couchii]